MGALVITVVALLTAAAGSPRLRRAALPGASGVIVLDTLVIRRRRTALPSAS